MKKIAVIGGGIIGLTLVNYLDPKQFEIYLFDDPRQQATRASAGIISPWLSKRRNKKWYQLAKDGAAFFEKVVQDFELGPEIYEKCGTLFVREPQSLNELAELAKERRREAPELGKINRLTPEETNRLLPLLKPMESLYITGGARLDGKAYLTHLKKRALSRGVKWIEAYASVEKLAVGWKVQTDEYAMSVDELVLCPGPALKHILAPLGYDAEVTPQKGQLIAFQTPYASQNWPVAFLEGAADLIPFQNGQILLGATHENEAKWDLTPTQSAFDELTQTTEKYFETEQLTTYPYEYRVGTRAYTPDFAPFFGPLPLEPTLAVASGLGSSGLTTGPLVAYLLASYFNSPLRKWETSKYQKELSHYIRIK